MADQTQQGGGSDIGSGRGGPQGGQGQIIASILTSMQQGVIAINNLTKTMAAIFPSSS